jgi:hypothetical protein
MFSARTITPPQTATLKACICKTLARQLVFFGHVNVYRQILTLMIEFQLLHKGGS